MLPMEGAVAMEKAERVTNFVATAFRLVAEAFVCVLVALVVYGTISRYLFSQPVFFMEEAGGLLFMGIAFLAFPDVFIAGGHIKLNLVTNRLPKAVRNWVEVVQGVVALTFFVVFAKVGWDFVYVSYQLDCHTPDMNLYEVPWQAILPATMVVMVMVTLIFVVRRVHSNVSKMQGKEVHEEAILDKTL